MRTKNHLEGLERNQAVGVLAQFQKNRGGVRAGFRTALLLCVALPAFGQSVKSLPQPVGYVSDFAQVMSPRTVARLNQLCGRVEQETHDRIDVVTVQRTGGEPIEQYAVNLQRAWKVGGREAMVLIAVGQRQRWIAAESALEAALSPADLEKISGQMVPMLRNNDFDGATTMAVEELAARMAQNAGVKMNVKLPWGVPAAVPAEDRWLKPLTCGLTVLMFASLGVWAYTAGLGDAVRRRMGKRMGRERR